MGCVSERVGMLIYGIGFLYMGWGVCLEDGVFVYGWSVSIRVGVLVYGLGC